MDKLYAVHAVFTGKENSRPFTQNRPFRVNSSHTIEELEKVVPKNGFTKVDKMMLGLEENFRQELIVGTKDFLLSTVSDIYDEDFDDPITGLEKDTVIVSDA